MAYEGPHPVENSLLSIVIIRLLARCTFCVAAAPTPSLVTTCSKHIDPRKMLSETPKFCTPVDFSLIKFLVQLMVKFVLEMIISAANPNGF